MTDEAIASISVTEKAASEVRRVLEQKQLGGDAGLRLGVKGGGCSGFSYVMNLEPRPARGDEIFDAAGLRVFVDPKSYLYLEGTQVDFNDDLTTRGFVFKNPQSSGSCGCGASFSA
ncbi:MAG: iron-sulfur cluster assembly accessory protein [Planctomycetes bacterium]|nr:iron-sulfur cluster assembly accessory protein [Planctomycetota bacterium]